MTRVHPRPRAARLPRRRSGARSRNAAIAAAIATLLVQLGWLVWGRGSMAWVTATVIGGVAVLAVTAGRVVVVNTAVRIMVGAMLAGSVADRFGLLGAPGAPGVSWGSYPAFMAYTEKLLPSELGWAAPTFGAVATVLEAAVGLALILGLLPKVAARVGTLLLAAFGVAMCTSVGFSQMSSYGVLVIAAGAAILTTCETSLRLDRLVRRPHLAPA